MSNPVLSQSVTTLLPTTLQTALDNALPGFFESALQQVKLGTMLSPLKVVFSGLTSASVQNITTAAAALAATIKINNVAYTAPGGYTLPPIQVVKTLRDAHANVVTDAGGTAVASTSTYPGTALLSDDGTTLTFAAAVTAFTLEYFPQAPVAMSTVVAPA